LAAELKRDVGAGTKLIASHGGVFEVSVDGETIFSKKSSGRFPEDGEIVGLIRTRTG